MQSTTDLTANAISANTLEDMVMRVFAVAELVEKANGQKDKPDTQSQNQCEKTQK